MVGKEVMAALTAFHSSDQWYKSLSATFITPIPKKKGASEIKDFHHISLVGCLYKLLAKILALRLKTVIRKVISPSQNSFILGRQITYCSLLENECIDAMGKINWLGIVYKIDMEKAYDHENWDYLDWVLQ